MKQTCRAGEVRLKKEGVKPGRSLLAFLFLAWSSLAAEPIKVQLNSHSLMVRPAFLRELGFEYRVEVTSDPGFLLSNGEMELAPPNVPYTHWAYFLYYDEIFDETTPLDSVLDIPLDDTNQNGLPDIFEFAMAAGGRTDGEFFTGQGTGDLVCNWSKPENSYIGTLSVRFVQFNQTFTHQIEIYEYSGTWTNATMTGTNGTVNLHLARVGVEGEFLEGPLAYSIADQKLTIKATGEFKTEGNAPFQWDDTSSSRLTNGVIYAFATLIDGTPTIDPEVWNVEDFNEWQFMIIDPNDADSDGVPDLLEGTSVTPPERPELKIEKTVEGIRITIKGEAGRTYILEDANVLPPTDWLHPMNVPTVGVNTTVDLPAPTGPTYWRARVL